MTTFSAPNGIRQGDVSYVVIGVGDAARATAFYTAIFGWDATPTDHGAQLSGPLPMVGIGEGVGGVGTHLSYRVDDIAVAVAAVRAGGGDATEPAERPYGLESTCHDPAGLLLWLHQFPAEDPAAVQGFPPGGISYVEVLVPDGDAARAFYGSVLDWSFADGDPIGTTPRLGIRSVPPGGPGPHGAVLSYTVTDVDAAVVAVRAAGGTAGEPEQRPYGLRSRCTDDQGITFCLCEYPPTDP